MEKNDTVFTSFKNKILLLLCTFCITSAFSKITIPAERDPVNATPEMENQLHTASYGGTMINPSDSNINPSHDKTEKESEVYDLILLAGQSNMRGRALWSERVPRNHPAETDVGVLLSNNSNVIGVSRNIGDFKALSPHLHKLKNTGVEVRNYGMHVPLARKLYDCGQTKLALINGASGGTSIEIWQKGERMYDDFLARITREVTALKQANKTINLVGFGWQQGEADKAMSKNQYRALLNTMLSDLKADIENLLPGQANSMKVVLMEPAYTFAGQLDLDVARAMQEYAANNAATTSYVSTIDLTTRVDNEPIHWDAVAIRKAGNRLFNAMISCNTGPVDETLPNITDLRATYTESGVTLNWSDVAGETGYRVRRFRGDDVDNIGDVAANTLTFTDTNPEPGTEYTYVVRPMLNEVAVATSNKQTITIPSKDEDDTETGGIRVLPPRNDIPRSNEYQVFVSVNENGPYEEAHVHHTFAKNNTIKPGYSNTGDHFLRGYKMGYVNFEFGDQGAWVKVVKKNGNISNLEVRPSKKGAAVKYVTENDKRVAKIRVQAPTTAYLKTAYLSVVPLSGAKAQLENTLGIFANPFIDVPTNNLVVVQPGTGMPKASNLTAGQTVVFKPGTHNMGLNYKVKNGVNYYFANGAFVKGTFEKEVKHNNIRVYGLGILSGAHLPRFINGTKQSQAAIKWLRGSSNLKIEDITIEDPSHHSLTIGDGTAAAPNEIRRVKIMSWRPNGDGIHISGYALVEDCFTRTQDDGYYVASSMDDVTIRRISSWNDGNGSAFIFTAYAGGKNCVVRDADILYHRGNVNNTSGGNVIDLQGLKSDAVIENILLENIRVEDKDLNKRLFDLKMQPGKNSGERLVSAKFRNITFRNWTVASDGGLKSRFLGYSNTIFPQNITFDCVSIGGQELTDLKNWTKKDLKLNEIQFMGCNGNGSTRLQADNVAAKDKELRLYPNPAESTVTLDGQEDILYASIYTLSGALQKQITIFEGRSIDVSELINGTYILSVVYVNGHKESGKLIIRH